MPRPARSDPPKREAILDAGARIFLRHGYERATMDEVAAEAKVSKRTVYDHFASKERLFGAIVNQVRAELFGKLGAAHFAAEDPRVALTRFAELHLRMAMSERVLELYRVVVAEAPRLPGPARIMFDEGFDLEIAQLADYLRRQARKRRLSIDDARRSAEGFIGLLAGYPTTHVLMGLPGRRSERELRAQVRFAVRTFLDGCRRGRR